MNTTTPSPSPSTASPQAPTCLPAVGDVLAIVAGPRDGAAYVASRLAGREGGSVTGCATSPAFLGGRAFRADATVAALLEVAPSAQRREDLHIGGAGDAFVRLAISAGARGPQWAVMGNDTAHTLAMLSAWHDLIVVQRPTDPHADPLDGLGILLMGTGLPCLVLPAICAPSGVFDRVVLAWDGSRPAIRAIRAALPLVAAAQDVLLLDGCAPRDGNADAPGFEPMAFLARQGIEATRRRVHASPAEAGATILKKAHQFKADLLVMGAYGHTPLREKLFGGATRHVLTHGDIATLLYH
ncbi:universal stress protein [Luteibacter yeojuensis]|uniref:Universal stress protein n=1 Tax=Luteibacter yeojuensis TaxID=345309 RepID=A0A7X5QSH7_9GAMM|nr:universal stress protein [Luteibacter yeojuensis]NID14605.1 universal stress protein [Luteibacter yeojuensis]